MAATCPICHQVVESEPRSGPYPFCSWRCKKLDLYSWLNEEYRISEPAALVPARDAEQDVNRAEVLDR
jgi:endogenous inhibitor of DNA gyrase (YacG/DUF329 family)